jgi:hypothetical protein
LNLDTSRFNLDGPPVISVNGNNPATISVGSSYSDLGASITGPAGDLNHDNGFDRLTASGHLNDSLKTRAILLYI